MTGLATLPWPVMILAAAMIVTYLARAAMRGTPLQRGADIAIAAGVALMLLNEPRTGFFVFAFGIITRLVLAGVKVLRIRPG